VFSAPIHSAMLLLPPSSHQPPPSLCTLALAITLPLSPHLYDTVDKPKITTRLGLTFKNHAAAKVVVTDVGHGCAAWPPLDCHSLQARRGDAAWSDHQE